MPLLTSIFKIDHNVHRFLYINSYTVLKEQCISVTELRTKTKECLKHIQEAPKFVFINNKPIAVLVDIDTYETYIEQLGLHPLPLQQATKQLTKQAAKAQKIPKKDLTNI